MSCHLRILNLKISFRIRNVSFSYSAPSQALANLQLSQYILSFVTHEIFKSPKSYVQKFHSSELTDFYIRDRDTNAHSIK